MAAKRFKWKRKSQSTSKTSFNCSQQVKNKIKEAKTHGPLKEKTIENILSCQNSFVGCFAADELSSLVLKFPCFIIVNLDKRNMKGSHWIAIGCFKNKLEIFDPLGFDLFSWPKISCDLLFFLHKYSFSRKILLSKRIQAPQSQNCGLYCIYYVMTRKFKSFSLLQSIFSSKLSLNDSILIKQFYHVNA